MEQPATPVPLESLLAHREWVRQVARALVVDESRAEDLEQEAWLEALRRPPADARSLRGWLGTVLRHKAADAGRSEARRERRESAAARPEATPDAADLVAEADAHQRLVRAVLDLEEPYRSTMLLRYFEDLGPAAIAARVGVPLETVRTRLRRGLEALRERFDREAGGDRNTWRELLAPLALGSPGAAGGAAGSSLGALLALFGGRGAVAATVAVAGGLAVWLAVRPGGEESSTGGTVAAVAPAAAGSPAPNAPSAPPPTAAPAPALPATAGDPAPAAAPAAAPPAAPAPTPGATGSAPPPAPPAPSEEPSGRAAVEVIVVDRRGRPLPGAGVKIHGPGRTMPNFDYDAVDMDPPAPRPVVREGVADGTGRFAGERLAPGPYWVRASNEKHAAATVLVRLEARDSRATVRVLLEPEAVLEGVVRRADGSPAAGVRVVARRFVGLSLLAFDRLAVVAGPDGAYRIAGLAPGVHDILLGPSADLLLSAGAVEVPRVSSFDPRLPPGAVLRGRVVDGESGAAVAGATVRFSCSDPVLRRGSWARTVSGPDGAWRIEGLPGGTDGWLRVRKEGYLPSFDGGSNPQAHVQGITAGGEFVRDVRLARGGRVKGRVKDADGKPVAGAWVHVETYTENGMQQSPVAVTGADGTYSVDPVHPGSSVLLVQAPGFSQRDVGDDSAWDLIRGKRIPPSAAVPVAPGETVERDLVLDPVPGRGDAPPPPSASLAGRAKLADGSAPKGLRLRLLRDEDGGSPYWALRNAPAVESGESGSFRLEGLRPGRVALAAEAEGCALGIGPWVVLENGKPRDGYELVLAPARSISGSVVDAAGAPIPGAGISIDRIAEDHFLAVTDAKGAFTVTGLAEGEWILKALVPGSPPASAIVTAGAADVVLAVHGRTLLRGRVVDAETGAPIPDISVRREWRGKGGSEVAHTGLDGAFTLPAGAGGPEEITAGLVEGSPAAESDYVPETREFPGPPEGEVRIALRKGLAIAGRVLAEDGTPLRRRFDVEIDGEADPGWPFFRWTWFLEGELDGTFRVRGLPPGKFDLVFEDDDDDSFTPILVEDVRSGTLDLVVQQERALAIEGRVVDEEGNPPGVAGWVQPLVRGREATGPALPATKVGPDGVFRTSPVHAKDTVDLFASRFEGFLEARIEKVEPGATAVVLRIRRGAVVSGRVLDPAGNPLPEGVPVAAFLPRREGETRDGHAGSTKTGEGGAFTLQGLPGERFLLEAGDLGSDFIPAEPRTPVEAGARDVVLRARPGLTVEVVVLGGGDVDMLRVSQGDRGAIVHPDEEGRIHVRGLEPGKFTLWPVTESTSLGEFDASAGKVEIRLR